MKGLYLDTHVVIDLYSGNIKRLPNIVKNLIELKDLFICPMVFLEIQYLKEIIFFLNL